MVNLIPTSVWMYSTLIRDPELVASVRADPEGLIPSIVEETLRLFSRPNMYRQVTKDFALTLSTGAQVRLSAGDWVALFPRFLHHDPTVFRDALSFNARRFCPVNGAKARFVKDGKPLQHATVVFGLGRGRCPGDTFALSVLAVALKGWVQALEARSESTPLPEAVRQTVASTPGPAAAIYAWLKPAGHQEYSP
jgi:cytochrome P450